MATLEDIIDLKPLLTATGGCRDGAINDAICQNMLCFAEIIAELQSRIDLNTGGGSTPTQENCINAFGNGPHTVLEISQGFTECNVVVTGSVTFGVTGNDGDMVFFERDIEVLCDGVVLDTITVSDDIPAQTNTTLSFNTTVSCTGDISLQVSGGTGAATTQTVGACANAFCTMV